MKAERIILGVDPGTQVMGFGLLKIQENKLSMIAVDELILKKFTDPYLKLKRVFEKTIALVDEYKPDEIALEAPFFGENVQSMLKLGRVQGVAMAAALSREVAVTEYQPTKVKMAVCGNGRASKEQLGRTVCQTLGIPVPEKYWDGTDALAVAICHYYQSNNPLLGGKKYNSWDAFVKANPNKISK